MKHSIRYGVFETNSSSIHSLAIPKSCDIFKFFSFHIGEFGWTFTDDNDPCDYFYTAIYEVSNTKEELKERLTKFKSILDNAGIDYHLGTAIIKDSDWCVDGFYLADGYIDHGCQLRSFVDDLLQNSDKLLRFLSNGLVFTGNDNSDTNGFFDRDSEYIKERDFKLKEGINTKNKYYMKNYNDYDWYTKGN